MYVKERSFVMKRMAFCAGIVLASAIAFGTVPENFEYNFREEKNTPLKTVRRSHSMSEVSNLYATDNYFETINPSELSELIIHYLVLNRDDTEPQINFYQLKDNLYKLWLDQENAKLRDEVDQLEEKLKQTHLKKENETNCYQLPHKTEYHGCIYDPYQSCNSDNFQDNPQPSTLYGGNFFPDLSKINVNCINKELFKR